MSKVFRLYREGTTTFQGWNENPAFPYNSNARDTIEDPDGASAKNEIISNSSGFDINNSKKLFNTTSLSPVIPKQSNKKIKKTVENIRTLVELQKVLGERIESANSKDVDAETRKTDNETSQVIASLAKQMINNADVVLRAVKLVAEGKLKKTSSIKGLIE